MLRPLPQEQSILRSLILMALLALVLTIIQHHASSASRVSFPEVAARGVVWPVQWLLVGVGTVLRNSFTAAFYGSQLARENRELRERVAELEAEKTRMLTYYYENREIRRKLGFDPPASPLGTAARVVGWSTSGDRRRVTIRAGRDRPLEVGRVVVTAAGLVGRIVEVQGRYAQVVLLVEPGHAIAGIIQRQPRDQGMVYPATDPDSNQNLLQMSKLRRGADIRVGDIVLSSGLGGVYPPGLRIGMVERIQRAPYSGSSIVAIIRPFADFNHLDYVLVLPRQQ